MNFWEDSIKSERVAHFTKVSEREMFLQKKKNLLSPQSLINHFIYNNFLNLEFSTSLQMIQR